jgi:NhaP-type Na+/H+ or K+/H+ antiporter
MTQVSVADMMLAAALVFGLATACQIIAPKLRIPALILLLPVGFLFGLLAPGLRMNEILGSAFPVAVDLMVALILFQGGMELGNISLKGTDATVVRRLLWIGGATTLIAGTLAVHFILGLAWPLAVLLGSILIVSGPTVVTPILDLVRLTPRVRGILLWEGTTLDPLGAILAVVVFQIVKASNAGTTVEAIGTFFASFVVAVIMAAIGVALAVFGIKLVHPNHVLGTQVLIGSVIVATGFANFLVQDSGLLTALLMGIATPRLAKRLNSSVDPVKPFFNTIASIGIGVLFISIAALVPSPFLSAIVWPAIGVSLVLIVIVRPFISLVCTPGAGLSGKERVFIGWMDPRGIVAAATASSVGAALVATKVPGAEKLLPAAFIIITVTVFVYGLTAVPVAAALGLRQAEGAEKS